ncbi:hypothetical protein Trydic_g11142 [Trypoxylus dichotomus]
MILVKRLTYSGHLKKARTKAIGRIFQLYLLLSYPHLNPKMGIMLYKLHIRPILIYAGPSWVTAIPSHIQSLVRVQNRCLRIVLHAPSRTILAALKALTDGEDLQEFLDKLNSGFFEKTLASENPALQTATARRTYGATKHRTVTKSLGKLQKKKSQEVYGSTRKTSRSHGDTQMSLASSRKEDTGGKQTEDGHPPVDI